ncbi:MAG: PilX N-terminal domain-containing pilus assembly protein [Gammaproteobacteria bacterium]|nr:PilX N-terminal domain-containing pilus assembly protein [Gammaproteobacteria bacterium]
MRTKRLLPASLNRQQGVALFISLVLLLILTIIGISAVQTTTLETRMARNEHDTMLAFQAAESALRDGEEFLEGIVNTGGFTDGGAGGLWTIADFGEQNRWVADAVWEGGGSIEADTEVGDVVAEQPRYLIEHIASVIREENAYQLDDPYAGGGADRIEMFRITARGVGGSPNARVMLQTTYGRILD